MRLFQAIDLIPGQSIWLDEQAAHYVARVLRATIGEALTLFDGKGTACQAVISHINKKGVMVCVGDYLSTKTESSLNIYLAQGISRGEKMDFVIQKSVELGVTHFFPLLTDRCNVKLSKEREQRRMDHWRGIMISACEQSGRNILPELSQPLTLAEWLPMVNACAKGVLSPHAKQAFSASQWPHDCRSFALLIGPEGGLSDQEISCASYHHFCSFHLGPRILRTETATITALSILQYQYGDLRG
jgi:16S rRNA (uracil1498-N3)-methyltransferase